MTEDPLSRSLPQCVAELLAGSVVDCGDVMQGLSDCEIFTKKCVQNSVLHVLPDHLARRARFLILSIGTNSAPTGNDGNQKCVWNLHVLQKVLRMIHAFVWVVSADSQDAMASGRLEGRWLLGDPQGACCGAIAWFYKHAHAAALVGPKSCSQSNRYQI